MRNQSVAVADKDSNRVSSGFDRKFGWTVYGALLLALLLSTWLHHARPLILNVPDNLAVGSWERPALEQSILAERLSAAQRSELLSTGVPQGADLSLQFAADAFILLLGWLCFRHALRHYGFWMASCFLVGSLVFTGLEESLWILAGRFLGGTIQNPLGEPVTGTYWFSRGGFWFLETPLTACVGWFFIAYACVLTAGRVFPRLNLWARAAAGGLIAMTIDLWMDPVQTAPEILAWVWGKGDVLLLFGIPHYNFLGWFLLIFVFAVFWERLPRMETRLGRAGATCRFFALILSAPFAILLGIWAWLGLLGELFSLLGVQGAIRLPSGW